MPERGLRGVYGFVVLGLRPPSRSPGFLGAMRLCATTRVLSRHLINPRNEGVRGSNPRVGFGALQGMCAGCLAVQALPVPTSTLQRRIPRPRLRQAKAGPNL